MVDAEHAVRLAPTNDNAVALLAMIDKEDGHPDQALALVNQAVRHHPAPSTYASCLPASTSHRVSSRRQRRR